MDDAEIISFGDVDEWDRWLGEHGGCRSAAWLTIAKKGAAGVTATQAGDVAICHGWIDSHRRRLTAAHFLQRFSPRRAAAAGRAGALRRAVATLEAATVLR